MSRLPKSLALIVLTIVPLLAGCPRDRVAPVIALIGAASITVPFGAPYVDLGAIVSDNSDNNLPAVTIDASAVNVNVPGTYTVTFSVRDAAGNAATAQRSVTVQEQQLAIVLDLSEETDVTVSSSPVTLSGTALAISGTLPATLSWSVTNSAKDADGTAPVGLDGAWTCDIPVEPGDNTIVLSFPGTQASETLHVTLNASYTFGGQVSISPDVAYVGEARELTAQIALTDADTDPSMITLIGSDLDETVATLTDDGNLTNGDEIEGDGIFTGRFTVTPATDDDLSYRVQAGRTSVATPAFSEKFQLLVTEHLSAESLNAILDSQGTFQQMLEAASLNGAKAVDDTIAFILSELENDPTVVDFGASEGGGGVWLVYASGIAGVVYAPSADIKAGAGRGTAPVLDADAPPVYKHFYKANTPQFASTGPKQDEDLIGSNKAKVIAAQFFDWGDNDDIPAMHQQLIDFGCLDVDYIQYNAEGVGNVEDFKNLGDYGIVLISSHGDSFYNGVDSEFEDQFGWNGTFGEVVLHSNMGVTDENRTTYEDDLLTGRLVIWGTNYGIMPDFVSQYSGAMPNSLVYMSICRGTWNGTLAEAFIGRGAGAFIGFDEYVSVPFCQQTGPTILTEFLMPDSTIQDAFDLIAGTADPNVVNSALHPAVPIMFGDGSIMLDASGLKDPSFESNNISQAWTRDGDARIIPVLGDDVPTDGAYMAIISTGLGFTVDTGTLSQNLCLPDTAATISFDWNFYSEEFLEYVGSTFQDAFIVTLTDTEDAANTVTLLNRSIDSLAGEVTQVAIGFDRGDVYATGWRDLSAAIPEELKGKRVALEFFATDVGDSIYDTAVLIDHIVVGVE